MLDKIIKPLVVWYQVEKRNLPWREQENPYYTWVSEIMLQQTRVEAVIPFFHRFIETLPTIVDLANCKEKQLLKLWEGLGYYNRVRNMQKAAQIVVDAYQGELPNNYEALLKLPGIGSYTAGAIGSIGFDLPVPAVDGNVLRVISRVREDYGDIMKVSVKKKLEQDLLEIMPKENPGDFNQALMELGATVCIPNGMARCDKCPLQKLCLAHLHGTVLELPVKTKNTKRKIEKKTVLVIQDGDKVAIRKRQDKGLLAGLYELPNLEGHLTEEEVLIKIKKYGLEALHIKALEENKHIFSHIEWKMIGYQVRVSSFDPCKVMEETASYLGENKENPLFIFADQKVAEEQYAIPAAFHSYAKYMNIRIGQEKFV